MKKLISILLVCFLILPLVGCPSSNLHVVREKVSLVVLAGQSGARGKALVSDLDEEYKEINVDVDILADGLPMGELVNIPGINEEVYFEALEPGYGDSPSEFGPEIGMGETLASANPKFPTLLPLFFEGFPDGSVGKESACNAGDPGSIPGSGRSPGERDRLPSPAILGLPLWLS